MFLFILFVGMLHCSDVMLLTPAPAMNWTVMFHRREAIEEKQLILSWCQSSLRGQFPTTSFPKSPLVVETFTDQAWTRSHTLLLTTPTLGSSVKFSVKRAGSFMHTSSGPELTYFLPCGISLSVIFFEGRSHSEGHDSMKSVL